jgi:hypothetical protein
MAKSMEEALSISHKGLAGVFSDIDKFKPAFGLKSEALRLSEQMLQTDRMIGNVTFSVPRYEDIYGRYNYADTIKSIAAAQEFAWVSPKQLLESQALFRSEAINYKSIFDSAYANLFNDKHLVTNAISSLQKTWDTAGVTRSLLLENYSKAIQTISGSIFPPNDFMFESVRRILENENNAFLKATQLANESILKSFLSVTPEILNQAHFAFPTDLIQKAIAPFVHEWAWLVCEVRLVSVDIAHGENHLLHAEYDRETAIELLAARIALEEAEPDVCITSSGDLEEPNDLFECSGEHTGHYAHYQGETLVKSKDDRSSTKKTLSQSLYELRQKEVFTEEEWDQIETDARRAERFVRENFADMMHLAFAFLMELSVVYVKENPMSAEEYRERQDRALARLRDLLPKLDGGRPEGTGLFKNIDDFQMALKDVLGKAHKKLSQREALHAIRQHPLCQKQTKDFPSQNETKTLRNWLDKCEMKYKDALEKYWKPAQKGK